MRSHDKIPTAEFRYEFVPSPMPFHDPWILPPCPKTDGITSLLNTQLLVVTRPPFGKEVFAEHNCSAFTLALVSQFMNSSPQLPKNNHTSTGSKGQSTGTNNDAGKRILGHTGLNPAAAAFVPGSLSCHLWLLDAKRCTSKLGLVLHCEIDSK
jgi:hypothetical protein